MGATDGPPRGKVLLRPSHERRFGAPMPVFAYGAMLDAVRPLMAVQHSHFMTIRSSSSHGGDTRRRLGSSMSRTRFERPLPGTRAVRE